MKTKAKVKAKRGRPRGVEYPTEELKPNPPPPKKCATCVHWKNKQALLNYSSYEGFCVNDDLSFNTTNGRMVGVVDKANLRDRDKITGNPSHDFETLGRMPYKVKISQYNLQTNEEFGCLFHTDDI
jgi:hypothetical protein